MRVKRSLVVVGLVLTMSALAFAAFVQSFEFDTFDWTAVTRVPTLTNDIPSESGTWHAEADRGAFTRWGGYSETFPPGGYVTTVDIYLDISPPYMTGLMPYPNDTRFDWTSAVSTPACAHRRDFAFNAGFYTDGIGMIPRFVISASNNTGRGNSFPKNPERDPFTIYVEGWYTFEHRFYALPPTPGGVLHVDLTIKDAVTGAPLHMWTLSTATDIIGTTVGGNRYGWFPTNEFTVEGLPIDTSALVGFQDFCVVPQSTAGAKITGGGWIEATGGGKGTFGLTAQAKGEAPTATASGNVTYHDPNRKVKSTAVTSVVVSGPCATIRGDAKVNDGPTPMGFEVRACDMGDPGDNQDTFSITLFDGYTAGGELQGGNIQLH